LRSVNSQPLPAFGAPRSARVAQNDFDTVSRAETFLNSKLRGSASKIARRTLQEEDSVRPNLASEKSSRKRDTDSILTPIRAEDQHDNLLMEVD
jgi:hypothetical protein